MTYLDVYLRRTSFAFINVPKFQTFFTYCSQLWFWLSDRSQLHLCIRSFDLLSDEHDSKQRRCLVWVCSLCYIFFCIRYNQVWCTCGAFEHVHPACYDSHVILFIGAVCYSDKYVVYQRLDTVNFMRILFSWIALKTYLQCLKFTDKAQFTYVSKQQSDFVISRGVYFHQNFAHVKFRGNKTFEKISKFTVTNILVEISTVNVLKIQTHFSSFRIATQYSKIPDFPTFSRPIFTIFIHLTFKIFIQIFMLADLYFKKNLKPLI